MNDYYEQDKFTDACNEYLEKNVIAEYVAFYFSYGYSHNVLGSGSLMQHFNSAVDVFNVDLKDEDKIISDIRKILEEKYSLKIVSEKQLKFDKI